MDLRYSPENAISDSMSSFRAIARTFGALLSGVIAALAVLEGLARVLPVWHGAVAADPTPLWPVHRLIQNTPYTFSAGWDLENVRHGSSNNMGYVAPFNYVPGAAGIAVIGDSFVESEMNAYDETLQGVLPHHLNVPVQVMNFGTSGAALPHYLGVATLVGEHFAPQWAVVVATRGNFVNGFVNRDGYYHWAAGEAPGIELAAELKKSSVEKFFRDLSLTGYLRVNLQLDLKRLFVTGGRVSAPTCTSDISDVDRKLIAYFASELPRKLKVPPSRVIFVFDSDRDAMYRTTPAPASAACPDRDAKAQQLLAAIAVRNGGSVVDTGPIFRSYYEATGRRLDYSPTDSHWNAAAHALVARKVADIINTSAAP